MPLLLSPLSALALEKKKVKEKTKTHLPLTQHSPHQRANQLPRFVHFGQEDSRGPFLAVVPVVSGL